MGNSDEPIGPIVYLYAVLNLVTWIVKIGVWIAAIWMALKPDGSVLAAILMVVIGSFIRTRSYGEDAARAR